MVGSQGVVYGGDEVSALVVDPGSYYTRFGFAGEDTPKAIISSNIGVRPNPDYDEEMANNEPAEPASGTKDEEDDGRLPNTHLRKRAEERKKQKMRYYFGDDDINMPKEGMEIVNPMKNGLVADWDLEQRLWDYAFTDVLGVDPSEHPLLMTEQIWNPDEQRIKAMEMAFETFDAPAFYVVKSPVCSLFASGKGSGLVVDIGDQITTVTPVIDGLTLFKPAQRSRVAGAFLSRQVVSQLKSRNSIEIVPRYKIASKEAVAVGEPPRYSLKSAELLPSFIPKSFDDLQVSRVAHEFKETTLQLSANELPAEGGEEEQEGKEFTSREFEFPNGYAQAFGAERYRIAESLFKPRNYPLDGESTEDDPEPEPMGSTKMEESGEKVEMTDKEKEIRDLVLTDRTTTQFMYKGVSELIVDAINACDVDIRANLANNIVITGSGSLVQGLTDRINQDLSTALTGLKIRLYAPGNTTERKNSAWIGGSILASLGTFHQLWISKKEYEEVGASKLLEKRFR
ncbi:actin-related protein 4 [Trichomonascus vanleenenianus]|uniref:actin family protein n=1 Tax=Trichomonascus vanleenenianus TaxID=2268995 RepID=UPI003ECB6791